MEPQVATILPKGYKFHPTDEELICFYLHNKIVGQTLPCENVQEFDLYGKTEPWEIWEVFGGPNLLDEDLYLFTKLKKKTTKKSKESMYFERKVGAGSWKGDHNNKVFARGTDICIGFDKSFHYANKNSEHNGQWLMHEYSIHSPSLHLTEVYVVCRIKKNVPERRRGIKRDEMTSNGDDDGDDTDNGDDDEQNDGAAAADDDDDGDLNLKLELGTNYRHTKNRHLNTNTNGSIFETEANQRMKQIGGNSDLGSAVALEKKLQQHQGHGMTENIAANVKTLQPESICFPGKLMIPQVVIIPKGYKFHPTDEELIHFYLYNKIVELALPCDAVKEFNLYGKTEPWTIWEEFGGSNLEDEDLYFFTKLKKMTKDGVRFERKAGTGSWKENQQCKKVFARGTNIHIGFKKRLHYFNENSEQHGGWIMYEYSIESPLLHPKQSKDYVVCRIIKNGPERKRRIKRDEMTGNGDGDGDEQNDGAADGDGDGDEQNDVADDDDDGDLNLKLELGTNYHHTKNRRLNTDTNGSMFETEANQHMKQVEGNNDLVSAVALEKKLQQHQGHGMMNLMNQLGASCNISYKGDNKSRVSSSYN